MAIIAWHGEQQLKDKALERLREHRRLDRIAQGKYWTDGRGCLLGCLTHREHKVHESAERLFGIAQRIGYWLEWVFEGLCPEDCEWWVIASAEAIPAGADLSQCHNHLCLWLLRESGLLTITDANRGAINHVARLHERVLAGEYVSLRHWSLARCKADSATQAKQSNEAIVSAHAAVAAADLPARSTAEAAGCGVYAFADSRSLRTVADEDVGQRANGLLREWGSTREAIIHNAWKHIADKSLEIFAAAPVTTERTECRESVQQAYAVLATDKISEFVTP